MTRTPHHRTRRPLAGLLLALLLLGPSACITVGPDYEAPVAHTPDLWHQSLTEGLDTGQASLRTWWTLLEDPVLDGLIERAGANNLDLRLALARVAESRARLGFAKGERVPAVDGVVAGQRTLTSEDLLPASLNPGTQDVFGMGIDSSWEVDLWGRIRRSVESASASLEASVEDYRDVLVTLYAEVALNYIQVRALQQQILYTEGNIQTQRDSLQLTTDRNDAGLVGDLDVRQAELNLARTESFLPALRQQLVFAIHRLSVLVGEFPSALHAELIDPKPIPQPPAHVAVGLPSELLRQRPDVRAAERSLASQTARIGVAKAELYPRLSLVGTFSLEASSLGNWVSVASKAFSFGPTIRWNLFNGGRVRAQIDTEEALTEQALVSYEQSVLLAYEEVENAMVAFTQEIQRRDALNRSVVAAEQAVDLVDELYRLGLVDFQNVLDTQRSLFQQQDEYAASQGQVTQNLIQIYKALGGGWTP